MPRPRPTAIAAATGGCPARRPRDAATVSRVRPEASSRFFSRAAHHVRQHQDGDHRGDHAGHHRDEQVVRGDLQHRRGPDRRPAPGHDVQHAVRQAGHDGEHDRAHPQLQVDRQQRGHGDDERGRAVAVERHHAGQHRGPDHQPDRAVADHPQDEPDQRIEQTDVDHQPEVDDREEQQRRGRRETLDRVHDRVGDAAVLGHDRGTELHRR